MSRQYRVVFVAGADFFSGAERALMVTAQSLMEQGHHPFIVVGTDGELLAQLRQRHIPAAHLPLFHTGLKTVHKWAWSTMQLARLARRHGADLLHANEVPTFQMVGYAARLARIPAVSHFRFPEPGAGLAWYLKPGFTRALFVSEYLRQEAVRELPGVFDGRADVVYDGVVLTDVPTPGERAKRRADLDLPGDRPAIVIAGQVIKIKGIWDYIEAARILCDQGVRATFVVLGDDLKGEGETRRQAEQKVRELGLASHFRFLGFRSDAPVLIPAFDIVTVPSHIEPLGNATLEAMAAGRPVVGARTGGIPEMIVDGETGLLVPSKSPPELAAALAQLIHDPSLARRMGEAGRTRAAAVFSLAAHARRLEAIYAPVVDGLPADNR